MIPIPLAEEYVRRPDITFKPWYLQKAFFGLPNWIWVALVVVVVAVVLLGRR